MTKSKYIWIKDVYPGDIAIFRCGGKCKITSVDRVSSNLFFEGRFIKFKGVGNFGASYFPSGQLCAAYSGQEVKNCPFDIVAVEREL